MIEKILETKLKFFINFICFKLNYCLINIAELSKKAFIED